MCCVGISDMSEVPHVKQKSLLFAKVFKVRHVPEFLESFGDHNVLLKTSSKGFPKLKFDEIHNLGDQYSIVIITGLQACIKVLNEQRLSCRVHHTSIAVCYI